ncbi:MAG: hypothetical protein AAFW81_04410 [Pseudomonadota bacterium]
MEDLDPIQFWLVLAAVAYVAFLFGRATKNRSGDSGNRELAAMRQREAAEHVFASLPRPAQQEIDAKIQEGKTIEAVRLVRQHAGVGLREAKLAVDARRASMGL